MTILLILLALVAFALGGWGTSLVRSEPRAARAPFWASLAGGQRRTGALIAGAGLVLLIVVLLVRR